MMPADDTVAALREALCVSPSNIPLHQHLADTLVKLGRFADAETAFRDALAIAPQHLRFKLGLATAFFQQEKNSQSLVIVEDVLSGADVPAQAYLLHARLLLRRGEADRAAHQYREALAIDPDATDAELAAQLEICPRQRLSTTSRMSTIGGACGCGSTKPQVRRWTPRSNGPPWLSRTWAAWRT